MIRILLSAFIFCALAGNAVAQNFPGYGASGSLFIGQDSIAPPAWMPLSGDCTIVSTGVITCLKVNGTSLGTMATQNANAVAITGGTATGFGTPTNPADVAIKSYVDAAVTTGIYVHAPVAWATTAVLPNTPTYNNGAGTLTAGANAAIVVDSGNPLLGDRVLVKNQAAPAQNGAYTVTTVGSGSVAWVLTRATDFNTAAAGNVATGAYFFVSGGTANAFSSWTLSVTGAITIGTTPLTFVQFSSLPSTVAQLNVADQTVSGGANVTSYNIGTLSSGTTTIDCGLRPLQYFTNGGASTIAAPLNDGSCVLLQTNNASAGAETFTGFTVGASTGDALTTTNTNKFMITIVRINGIATVLVKALQ